MPFRRKPASSPLSQGASHKNLCLPPNKPLEPVTIPLRRSLSAPHVPPASPIPNSFSGNYCIHGRIWSYGSEFIIVIVSTEGLSTSSSGQDFLIEATRQRLFCLSTGIAPRMCRTTLSPRLTTRKIAHEIWRCSECSDGPNADWKDSCPNRHLEPEKKSLDCDTINLSITHHIQSVTIFHEALIV